MHVLLHKKNYLEMLDHNGNLYLAFRHMNILHSQTVLKSDKQNIENDMVFHTNMG